MARVGILSSDVRCRFVVDKARSATEARTHRTGSVNTEGAARDVQSPSWSDQTRWLILPQGVRLAVDSLTNRPVDGGERD